jgi:Methylamine utilisation protein MauE
MAATLARYFFALLLAASSVAKLADMGGFADVVVTYDVLLAAFVPIAAWTLVVFEGALAIWLFIGTNLRLAAWMLVALHGVYFCWLSVALFRGIHVPNCGCFGIYFPRPLTLFTLVEDLLLLGLALFLLTRTR